MLPSENKFSYMHTPTHARHIIITSGTVCRRMWPPLHHCRCSDNAWRQFCSAAAIQTYVLSELCLPSLTVVLAVFFHTSATLKKSMMMMMMNNWTYGRNTVFIDVGHRQSSWNQQLLYSKHERHKLPRHIFRMAVGILKYICKNPV